MSLYESKDSTGEVSLGGLFENLDNVNGASNIDLDRLAFLTCRGGWPKTVLEKNVKSALAQSIEYCEAVIRSDISRVDNVERNSELSMRLMRSYARNQGTQASALTIIQDIKANESDSLSENTIYNYINALKKIFVIEDSLAWKPNLRSKTSVRTSDTRCFSDPSIATAVLGLGPKTL